MAPSTITSLTTLAQALLTTSYHALQTTTEGAPALRYISPSAPAFDCCPALIVNVTSLSEEATSPLTPAAAPGMRDKYGRIILAGFTITALRCAPPISKNGVVIAADIEAVAVIVEEDGWALWNGITCAIKNETWKDLCSIVHLDLSFAIPEQGGCVGWQFNLRAEIGGIPCVDSSS